MVRRRPAFVIIGAQKSGTTSLLNYLKRHPAVEAPGKKELKYFDVDWQRGVRWYAGHFPLEPVARVRERSRGVRIMVGEKSPSYLFYPAAPARCHALLPDARIIALLREPCDRALSHYQHNHRRGREPETFEGALERERTHLAEEFARHDRPDGCDDPRLMHWSYLARGRYAEQLERWLALYPRERVLVLRAEDLFHRPAETFARVVSFLGLPRWLPESFETYNPGGKYDPLAPETRARIRAYFAPHNARLADLVGRELVWD